MIYKGGKALIRFLVLLCRILNLFKLIIPLY